MFVFNHIDIIKPYLLFLKSLFSFAFHFSSAACKGLLFGLLICLSVIYNDSQQCSLLFALSC